MERGKGNLRKENICLHKWIDSGPTSEFRSSKTVKTELENLDLSNEQQDENDAVNVSDLTETIVLIVYLFILQPRFYLIRKQKQWTSIIHDAAKGLR